MNTIEQWACQQCQHIGTEGQWSEVAINQTLSQFAGWRFENNQLRKDIIFNNFDQVEPFIIAIMSVARQQDHHPDVSFGYKNVSIAFSTHSAGGISDNDWICAAQVEQALK
jgi:4a-hydroxytetrahydrobiopterin dehydratase